MSNGQCGKIHITYSNCSEQPFWHVSHHDGHEEDHGFQEGISDEHGNHEESKPKEDGETSDDVHEMFNFNGDGCLLVADATCQTGNATDDGAIARVNDHTSSYTWRGDCLFLLEVEEFVQTKTHNTYSFKWQNRLDLLYVLNLPDRW